MIPVNDPAVAAFADLARGFCGWCEGVSLSDEPELTAASWLAQLYAAALALPSVEPDTDDGPPEVPAALLALAERNLASFRGSYYREFFDPHPNSTDGPGMGDIGDDLLDTYKDIKSSLLLYEGGQVAEALWHWSFTHQTHWGRHAVGALFAIHCLSVSARK